VEAVLLVLAAAAGASALWWHQSRPQRALDTAFEPEAEVALHVAGHEAKTRGHGLGSLHLLYGLLQDETITNALREAEYDPDALEDRVLAAIAAVRPSDEIIDEPEHVYGAAHAAHAHDRKVSVRDLWAHLGGSKAGQVLDAAGISHVKMLFQLCHGHEPAIDLGSPADVYIVLRNDDYTTREFVCDVLERVFAYSADDANIRMMETHTTGRAVIGRFTRAEARAKLQEVRDLARDHGFPLWIGAEPI
jgi:ATP-dependent Clp protease adaptor protein ClpS